MRKKLKEAVLDAAFDILEKEGPARLTLDAVAARAEVSKGGLLHHFRSKDALLVAMVDRLVHSFDEDLKSMSGAVPLTSQQFISTYLRHGFSGNGVRFRHGMVLIALSAHQPELLEPIRSYFRSRADSVIQQVANPIPMLAAMLMADGFLMFESLGITPLTDQQRRDVLGSVLNWVSQDGPSFGDRAA